MMFINDIIWVHNIIKQLRDGLFSEKEVVIKNTLLIYIFLLKSSQYTMLVLSINEGAWS